MATDTTPTVTVELDEQQRQLVLNALTDALLDAKRYLVGSEVPDTPGPEDTCCDAHLARYQHRREMYLALLEKKRVVKSTIALFEEAGR